MEDLKELAQVVSRNKVKQIRTLDQENRQDRVYDFYDRLLSDQFQNDAEAAAFYYKNPAQRSQYRKLKAKLRNRLHNTLFFIDVNDPKFGDTQKAFYSCHKELMVVRILLGRSARHAAIYQAEKTLKKAERFEFVDLIIELLRLLKNHHSLYTGNVTAYKKYRKMLESYEEVLRLEHMAMDYYEEIHVQYKKHLQLDKKTVRVARGYICEMEEHSHKVTTYRYHMMRFGLTNIIESLENNLDAIISNCDRAIRYFNKKNNVSKHISASYYLNKLLALCHMQDFSNGQKLAKKCIHIFEDGTFRWYKTYELYFYLCMHTHRYNLAFEIAEIVHASPNFLKQASNPIEWWRICQAYLYYLSRLGKMKKRHAAQLENFRINKFLNEVPSHAADKRGYNVPVLIVQILILIQQGAYDQLTDRIEAIEKYTTRYLKKDTNFRSNCFIKMLLQVPKRHFHKAAVVRHAKPYFKRLLDECDQRTEQKFEMEIIPYEHLWEHVLETLDHKFH